MENKHLSAQRLKELLEELQQYENANHILCYQHKTFVDFAELKIISTQYWTHDERISVAYADTIEETIALAEELEQKYYKE